MTEMLFLQKGIVKWQKCCSFGKEQQNTKVGFPLEWTTKRWKCCSFGKEQQKCRSVVPSKRNKKNAQS